MATNCDKCGQPMPAHPSHPPHAARIAELEAALGVHKHTDECMAYAVKTTKAGSGYYCIAKCSDARDAALKDVRVPNVPDQQTQKKEN